MNIMKLMPIAIRQDLVADVFVCIGPRVLVSCAMRLCHCITPMCYLFIMSDFRTAPVIVKRKIVSRVVHLCHCLHTSKVNTNSASLTLAGHISAKRYKISQYMHPSTIMYQFVIKLWIYISAEIHFRRIHNNCMINTSNDVHL